METRPERKTGKGKWTFRQVEVVDKLLLILLECRLPHSIWQSRLGSSLLLGELYGVKRKNTKEK
jgi:hypothetical protein